MNDIVYMQRALELAARGLGTTSPNPMVGCVIVHDRQIIGEGWHEVFGGPHAEVNAINDVSDMHLLAEATAYVTLEPCSFYGKTPACTDLLIKHKIKRVVVAAIDPNPKVAGSGIALLREHNIEVSVGVLEAEANNLNRRFITNMLHDRPYIILKWAQTQDGFLARENYDSKWISNQLSRQLVHKWRAEEDAILVGKHTVIHDDPSLTVRDWSGTNPLRIVLDRQAELKGPLALFDDSARTLIFNLIKHETVGSAEWVKLEESGFLQQALQVLLKRGVGSLIIEGGAKVLASFIDAELWDEARIFAADQVFETGIEAPQIDGALIEELEIEQDRLRIMKRL